MRALILGAGGQVGRALAAVLPDATALTRRECDIADAADVADAGLDWSAYDTLVNAAAFTDVDGAETAQGRPEAWRVNAAGPAALAALARRHDLILVHLSSEYVFDGLSPQPYTEDDPIAPLSVYGASKAAGDLAARGVDRHYVIRPTWMIGDGRNFVRTMITLAARGVEPTVVADQVGRPTFAAEIAAAIVELVGAGAPYGTYHLTGGGEQASWAEVARATYALAGRSDLTVHGTTTADYFADRPSAARRPFNSVLDLSKVQRAGVTPRPWRESLAGYVTAALSGS